MKKVVVVSAVRTAIGSIGGMLKNIPPEDLLRTVFTAAIDKAGIPAELIEEVVAGQTKQTSDAPNIARLASLMAGVPEQVPGYTVHRQCGSGMQAIINGTQQIQCGTAEVILCGGVESMSTAPFYLRGARFGVGNGNTHLLDPNTESQPRSQPQSIYGEFSMIQTADTVSRQFGITREEQDVFALRSQEKALQAMDAGKFREEITPVSIPQRKKPPFLFMADEFPKRDTSLERLKKLPPIFPDGFITAGNATGRNDGAAAAILMEEEKAKSLDLKPMARISGYAAAGVDPRIMGIAPVAAVKKLVAQRDRIAMAPGAFDLVEINEAFAAQSLACIKELRLDPARVNVNGGAIALGHPLGCSGVRLCVTLLHEMLKRNAASGLATMCIAGGLGVALSFERV